MIIRYAQRCVQWIKYGVVCVVLLCFSVCLFAQETEAVRDELARDNRAYQITDVQYDIKGITKQYPLSRAVPIDTARIFSSQESLQEYVAQLEQRFKNIRTIASVRIHTEYDANSSVELIPVTLKIAVTDTWNFVAIPYPSFDSNTGFQMKLKMQDFNFFGTLQPLKTDIVYRVTENNQHILSSSVNFALPFKAGIFDMLWYSGFEILYAYKTVPKLTLASGMEASYRINNRVSLVFGLTPELIINDRSSTQTVSFAPNKRPPRSENKQPAVSGTSSTPEAPSTPGEPPSQSVPDDDDLQPDVPDGTLTKQKTDPLGYVYPHDRYYFKTTFYVRAPVIVATVPNIGSVLWTPSMHISGNWAFDGIQADKLKNWTFGWGHSLSFAQVNWVENFRRGFSFSVGNTYAYKFYHNKEMKIGFTASATGYYPFINQVGIYGRTQFFYYLFKETSTQAGTALRGILNKRIDTDTGFTFNLDIPIRIVSLDFQTITGVSWTRFLNCDIQLIPFLDIALVHDKKTGRYYHPADGWYAGGLEMIVYPERMRSIYVRASLGFDLSELKNVPGLNKIGGRAKRDGEPISEIFIGIGVHY